MAKEFNTWNEHKKAIDARSDQIHFHEREIWWCSLGVNVGSEQDGAGDNFERPVLIIKKFNQDVLWAVPLSRSYKYGPYYAPIDSDEKGLSVVVLSQLRLISSKRLVRKIRTIGKGTYGDVLFCIKDLIRNEYLSAK